MLLRKAYDLIKSVDVCKAAFTIGPLEEQQLDGIRFGKVGFKDGATMMQEIQD